MFCPTCGSNQGEGKKFCTVCGTNLAAVSRALTGQFSQPAYYAPPVPDPREIKRQERMAKGVRLAIIGGGIVALKFFSFIFAGPFRGGSPFGFWTFIGFVLLGIGISKIISSRPPGESNQAPAPQIRHELHNANPQPVFSAALRNDDNAPNTSELENVPRSAPSVTEDETRQLFHQSPQR